MKQVHLWIRGRVQGVCFRMYAQMEAERLGITGWVRNLPDGRVEAVAQAENETVLRAFVAWCRHGPRHAQVAGVDVAEENAAGEFGEFRITHG